MDNNQSASATSKRLKIIIAVGLVVVIIAVIAVLISQKNQDKQLAGGPVGQTTNTNNAPTDPGAVQDAATLTNDSELTPANIPNLEGAKVAVPGANPITKENKVVNEKGVNTENAALPMSDTAPKQTGFLKPEELAAGVLKIGVGNGTFAPKQFTTSASVPTTFSLTGTDAYAHLIAFSDPSLAAIAILVGPGQTKAITFNAPATPGEYEFFCASPEHADKGEKGKMIVK
jgi:plastocyanin